MEWKFINKLPIRKTMSFEQRRLRKRAPKYISSIINDTQIIKTARSLEEMRPEHIKPLGGGVDAATYLINLPKERLVIKLGTEGIAAEAETISAWRQRHVRSPRIIRTGIVPMTKRTYRPIRYLVQSALVDPDGRIMETCDEYLVREPKKARQVGEALGRQLSKVHSSVSERSFGEFADSRGRHSLYKKWNSYLIDAISIQEDYLLKLGLEKEDVKNVLKRISEHNYVKQGRYLHGDFSIRNASVKRYSHPLKISLFDPNPLIGDPSWDISFLINNYEYKKRRIKEDKTQHDLYIRNQQLWIGFKKGYQRKINDYSLLSSQLIQAIYQVQYTEKIKDELGFQVRKEFIHELASRLRD